MENFHFFLYDVIVFDERRGVFLFLKSSRHIEYLNSTGQICFKVIEPSYYKNIQISVNVIHGFAMMVIWQTDSHEFYVLGRRSKCTRR